MSLPKSNFSFSEICRQQESWWLGQSGPATPASPARIPVRSPWSGRAVPRAFPAAPLRHSAPPFRVESPRRPAADSAPTRD